LTALRSQRVRDWRALESITAQEWLQQVCGERVYRVVWEPLLVGKFGEYAKSISAVWFWNKLKLRGGSRGKHGREMLAYYRGGFAALLNHLIAAIHGAGGKVLCNSPVTALQVRGGAVQGVNSATGTVAADQVLLTTPLPIAARLLAPHVAAEYTASLERIGYLSNLCVVLVLNRSISPFYWLNVNDVSFPFVAIIEHTNFEPPASYGGQHIVYLSKYLPRSAPLYGMSDDEVVRVSLAAVQRMFPELNADWVLGARVWRAQYAQPIVERQYSSFIPSAATPVQGVHLASMAQIYPEDRGTNYAVREGFRAAVRIMRAADCGAGLSSWEAPKTVADSSGPAPALAPARQIPF
jgi:protoporphyrinogen oxidase